MASMHYQLVETIQQGETRKSGGWEFGEMWETGGLGIWRDVGCLMQHSLVHCVVANYLQLQIMYKTLSVFVVRVCRLHDDRINVRPHPEEETTL